MSCPFCNLSTISERIFYEDKRWVAFLATPPYTNGHTILAVKADHNGCPTGIGIEVIKDLDIALSKVCEALKKKYEVKDVLAASLRGSVKHTHWHLIPLCEHDENNWRNLVGFEKGHLFEYLGYLEKQGVERARKEREAQDWNDENQRKHHTELFKADVVLLKNLLI